MIFSTCKYFEPKGARPKQLTIDAKMFDLRGVATFEISGEDQAMQKRDPLCEDGGKGAGKP